MKSIPTWTLDLAYSQRCPLPLEQRIKRHSRFAARVLPPYEAESERKLKKGPLTCSPGMSRWGSGRNDDAGRHSKPPRLAGSRTARTCRSCPLSVAVPVEDWQATNNTRRLTKARKRVGGEEAQAATVSEQF